MPRVTRSRARLEAEPEPGPAEASVEITEESESRKATENMNVDDINEDDHVETRGGGDEEADTAEPNSEEDAQYDIEDSLFEPLVLDMVRDEDDVGCSQETEHLSYPEPKAEPETGQGDGTNVGVEMEPDPPGPDERNGAVHEDTQVQEHTNVTDGSEMVVEDNTGVEQTNPSERENAENFECMDAEVEEEHKGMEAGTVPGNDLEVERDRVQDGESNKGDTAVEKEETCEELSSQQESDPFEDTTVAEDVKTEDDIAAKEESDGDDECSVVITDLRDLCPSLPIPSGKRITGSTRDIIQQAVQELIEKFLDDSENTCTTQPAATPEQGAPSEKPVRTYGCTLCDVAIDHPGRFEIHTSSRKHLNYLRWFNGINLSRERGPFYCGVCRVSLPGRDVMASHLKSDRHTSLSKLFNVDSHYATYVMDRIGGHGKVQISKSLQGASYTTPEEGKPDRDLKAADRAKDKRKQLQAQDARQGPPRASKSGRERDPLLSPRAHKPAVPVAPAPDAKGIFVCTLCGVTAQRESAMEEHLRGKRHRQKVKLHGGATPTSATVLISAPITQDTNLSGHLQQPEGSHITAETSTFPSDHYEEHWRAESQPLSHEQTEEACNRCSEEAELINTLKEEDADNGHMEGEAGVATGGEETELMGGEEGTEAACNEEEFGEDFFGMEEEADAGNAMDEGGTAVGEEVASEESQTALGLEQETSYVAIVEENQEENMEKTAEGSGKLSEAKHEESVKREPGRETSRHATSRDSQRHTGTSSRREPARDFRRHSRDDESSRDARGRGSGTGSRDARSSRSSKDDSKPDSRGDSKADPKLESKDDTKGDPKSKPNRDHKDSSRSDSKDEPKGGSREGAARGTRDTKRSTSGSDPRIARGSRDPKARDANLNSRDTRIWREFVRRRSSPARRGVDIPRRRASPSPERPLGSKKPKYSCLTCKVAIFSDRDYKDHFDSRRHRLEVERREKKDAERVRRRSPSPRTYRRHDRSRSPIEHRITAPLVIPSHPTHQTHDPSSFLQAQWLTPAAFVPMQQHPQQSALQHLQQLPQQHVQPQQHIAHHLQQQAQQQCLPDRLGVAGALPQAAAPALPLESYTERRPIVAGTLDNMILLQQQLLTLASAGRGSTAGALPMQRDYQNGLHQADPALQRQQESAVLKEQQLRQSQQYKGTASYSQTRQPAQQQTQFLDKSSSSRGHAHPEYKAASGNNRGIHFRTSTADGSVHPYGPQKGSTSSQSITSHIPARENYGQSFQQTTTNPSSRYGNPLDTSLGGKGRLDVQSATLQRGQRPQYGSGAKSSDVSSGYQFMQKRY